MDVFTRELVSALLQALVVGVLVAVWIWYRNHKRR
jgi:hypothetical protein